MKNKLPYFLDKRAITQKELAEKTNVSGKTIGNIVADKHTPNVVLAFKIAKVLRTKVHLIWVLGLLVILFYVFNKPNNNTIHKNSFKWTVSQKDCAKYKYQTNN